MCSSTLGGPCRRAAPIRRPARRGLAVLAVVTLGAARAFAAEPCSLRVGKTGIAPVPGHQHEFRFSLPYLAGRIRTAGFRIDEVAGKRTALRLAQPVLRHPSLETFRTADRLDRALARVPGYTRLAELVLIRGTRSAATRN